MIDERVLQSLRHTDSTVPPEIEGVIARGRGIRRRRRVLRSGAAVGVAVIVAMTASLAARSAGEPPAVEIAAPVDVPLGASPPPSGAACEGYAEFREPEESAVPRLLPTWLPAGDQIEHAWARAELTSRRTCPAVPTALVLVSRDASGALNGGARLSGPSPIPYREYEGPDYERLSLRTDNDARIVRIPSVDRQLLQLQWTEPDGTSWSLSGMGIDDVTLVAAATSLELHATGTPVAALSTPPNGLAVMWHLDRAPTDLADEEPYWHAVIDDGQTLSISVRRPIVPNPAIGYATQRGAQIVDVNGTLAVAIHDVHGDNAIIWDAPGDLLIEVSGRKDVATLLRIARSLAEAPTTDPRIRRP